MRSRRSATFSWTPGACRSSPSIPIQTNPWAGSLSEQGLWPLEGLPSTGFFSLRRPFRGYGSRSLYLSRGYAPGGLSSWGFTSPRRSPRRQGFRSVRIQTDPWAGFHVPQPLDRQPWAELDHSEGPLWAAVGSGLSDESPSPDRLVSNTESLQCDEYWVGRVGRGWPEDP